MSNKMATTPEFTTVYDVCQHCESAGLQPDLGLQCQQYKNSAQLGQVQQLFNSSTEFYMVAGQRHQQNSKSIWVAAKRTRTATTKESGNNYNKVHKERPN